MYSVWPHLTPLAILGPVWPCFAPFFPVWPCTWFDPVLHCFAPNNDDEPMIQDYPKKKDNPKKEEGPKNGDNINNNDDHKN